MKKYAILLVAAAGLLPVFGADEEKLPVPEIKIVRCETPPVIDGKIDDAVWKNAARTSPFFLFNTPKSPLFRTEAMLLHDDVNLYVAFEASDPEIRKWYAPSGREFDGSVWMDDCLEIYIADPESPHDLYQFVVNYDGVGFDRAARYGDIDWNGIWSVSVHIGERGYSAEFAIPLYTLGYKQEKNSLRMNLCREKYILPTELSSWSCAYGDFHFTERFGIVKDFSIAPRNIVLNNIVYPKNASWGNNVLRFDVANNTKTSWTGSIVAEDFRDSKYVLLAEQPVTLKSGEKKTMELSIHLNSDSLSLISLGTKEQDETTIVRQSFRNLRVPPALSVVSHPFIAETDSRSYAQIRAASPRDTFSAECVIRTEQGAKAASVPLSGAETERIALPVHGLQAGDYTVEYVLHSKSGETLMVKRPLKLINSPYVKEPK